MKKSYNTNGLIAAAVASDMAKTGMTWGYALIPISEILKDMPYQRPTDMTAVNRIVKEFDWDKVDPKCVNYRPDENKFAIMDGLHTLTALEKLGKDFIPCKVFIGKTYQEEAMMFAVQNKGTKRISTVDEFRALVEAGDYTASAIMRILGMYKIQLAPVAGVKKIRSVRKLVSIMEAYGVNGLFFTLDLIEDARWGDDPKAYTEGGLNVGYYAYESCLKKNGEVNKTKYKCLINILRGYKTSTQYVDKAAVEFSETITRHPQDAVKRLIQRDLEIAGVRAQQMLDYQKEYQKSKRNVIKVEG